MRAVVLVCFVIVFSVQVLGGPCTMPYSFLPAEIAHGSTIVMDGYEWSISEGYTNPNLMHRDIVRKNFEHHDTLAFITNDVALRIARNFFERNSRAIGMPSKMIVVVAGNKLPAIVNFIGNERQYCDGIPVIDTVSGNLYIGEGDEVQVSSVEVDWYVEADVNVTPQLSKADVEEKYPGSNPNLALLPGGGGSMTLVWELNDSKGTLLDANTGKEIKHASPYQNYYNVLYFLIPAIIVIIVGYIILTKKKPVKNKKT